MISIDNIKLAQTSNDVNILNKLIDLNESILIENIVMNPNCPKIVLLNIYSKNKYLDLLIQSPKISSNDLEWIYSEHKEDLNINCLAAFILNDNSPTNLLKDLYKTFNYEEIDELFVESNNLDMLDIISNNPNTSSNVLKNINSLVNKKLENDDENYLYQNIKYNLSFNPNTPLIVLKDLFNEKDKDINFNILEHKNCSKDLLKDISDTLDFYHKDLLIDISKNKDLIEVFCEDKHNYISLKALEKLDSLNINLKDTIEQVSNYNVDESTNTNKNKNKP